MAPFASHKPVMHKKGQRVFLDLLILFVEEENRLARHQHVHRFQRIQFHVARQLARPVRRAIGGAALQRHLVFAVIFPTHTGAAVAFHLVENFRGQTRAGRCGGVGVEPGVLRLLDRVHGHDIFLEQFDLQLGHIVARRNKLGAVPVHPLLSRQAPVQLLRQQDGRRRRQPGWQIIDTFESPPAPFDFDLLGLMSAGGGINRGDIFFVGPLRRHHQQPALVTHETFQLTLIRDGNVGRARLEIELADHIAEADPDIATNDLHVPFGIPAETQTAKIQATIVIVVPHLDRQIGHRGHSGDGKLLGSSLRAGHRRLRRGLQRRAPEFFARRGLVKGDLVRRHLQHFARRHETGVKSGILFGNRHRPCQARLCQNARIENPSGKQQHDGGDGESGSPVNGLRLTVRQMITLKFVNGNLDAVQFRLMPALDRAQVAKLLHALGANGFLADNAM